MKRDPVVTFLAALRRRLWLEQALHRARVSLGVSSAALLILASVNLWWLPLSLPIIVAAVLAVAALPLLPLLWSRPELVDAAMRADGRCGGHSSMTTALEVHRLAPRERSPAAQAVMAQAQRHAAEWRPRLGTLWRAPAAAAFVLGTIPALAGLLLLEAARSDRSGLRTMTQSPAVADPGRLTSPYTPDHLTAVRESLAGDDAEARRAEGSGAAGDNTRPARADHAPDDLRNTAASATAASAPLARAENSASAAERSRGAGSDRGLDRGSADGGEAGNAQRGPEDRLPLPEGGESFFRERIATTFERRGQGIAAAAETRLPFAASTKEAPTGVAVRPAAAPPGTDGWTTLTAAEVAYARRYLDAAKNARN